MSVVNILVIICSVFISLSIIVLCYISLSKSKSNRRDSLNKKVMDTYKNDMYDFLVNGEFSHVIIPRTKYIPNFEHLLMQFNYLISGKRFKQQTQYYAEQYFTEYYKQMLLSRVWSKRVNALTAIFDFKMRNLTEEVSELFHQKKVREDNILCYLSIKILVVNEYDNIFEFLKQYNVELASFQYRELFQLLSDEQWNHLIFTFNQLNDEFKLSLFDAIALFNKTEHQHFMENEITSELYEQRLVLQEDMIKLKQQEEITLSQLIANKKLFAKQKLYFEKELASATLRLNHLNELILRGLKSISIIGHTTHIDNFNLFLSTDIWQEKLMIIRLYGKMRLVDKKQFLIGSLSDSNYLVRKEAAHSLNLLMMQKEQLQLIYDQLDDHFARDILLKYISE